MEITRVNLTLGGRTFAVEIRQGEHRAMWFAAINGEPINDRPFASFSSAVDGVCESIQQRHAGSVLHGAA